MRSQGGPWERVTCERVMKLHISAVIEMTLRTIVPCPAAISPRRGMTDCTVLEPCNHYLRIVTRRTSALPRRDKLRLIVLLVGIRRRMATTTFDMAVCAMIE